jgi:hypothetical protein
MREKSMLFGNGRVEQFLAQHVTLAAADLHEPAVSEVIACTVANFHARMVGDMFGAVAVSLYHGDLIMCYLNGLLAMFNASSNICVLHMEYASCLAMAVQSSS